MTTCPHCHNPIQTGQLLCSHCGRPQLLINHQTLLLALPPLGLAVLVTLIYWISSQLFWLPVTQPLFYILADTFGLAYKIGNLESHTFFNGAWLVGGALLYIPLITYGGLRFGLKNVLVAALFGSLPFAFLDNWAWSAINAPGIVQFLIVFIIAAILIVVLHFLFIYLSDRWPTRFALIRAQAIRPSHFTGHAPILRLQLDPVAPLATDSPTATTHKFESRPIENREPTLAQPEPQPLPPPQPKSVPQPEARPSPVPQLHFAEPQPDPEPPEPKPVPQSGVKESAPPLQPFERIDSPPANQGGFPAWIIVVGLGILILIGIVLIIFALQT